MTKHILSRQNLGDGWEFQQAGKAHWLTAKVPGCVHTDLRQHGLIPDPFWGENERELQWIEDTDWTYRLIFSATEELFTRDYIDLVAEGLDTVSDISLNGVSLGSSESMFIGYRFPVKPHLKKGRNVLVIAFFSPMSHIRALKKADHPDEWNDPVGGSSLLRKEPCAFGWDWGPRLVSSGIYLPIYLEAWSTNRIQSLRISQDHGQEKVVLNVQAQLMNSSRGQVRGTVSLHGKIVADIVEGRAEISNPQLWWPNGMGEHPLYDVQVELVHENEVLDVCCQKIGLRTIELDRHADEIGETFQFVINGKPFFAKGANWIPAHAFITEATPEIYEDLLSSAAAANMNMLRAWGGGIYEKEIFFDLCDQKGLLVWQDFMFACANYPGDPKFLKLVAQEARYQVERLAHRACLALWCGNNEIEMIAVKFIDLPKRRKAYDQLFYHLLPEVVARHDGVTCYQPSSPYNPDGYEHGPNNECAGDAHVWEVWHARQPVKLYEEKLYRFVSEFGMQSYSSPAVAATYCAPEQFNIFGPEMENHQKNSAGNSIIFDYVQKLYRFPKDYASTAYLSQMNQAYCMKIAVEHYRRSMPRTMGALYWQLNDCWPCASWSSLEFGGRWKALHYEAKRFFAPTLVSVHIPGRESTHVNNTPVSTIHDLHVYTVYDGPTSASAILEWSLHHLDGRTLRHGEKKVRLNYGQSVRQLSLDCSAEMKGFGAAWIYFRTRLRIGDQMLSQQTVFLTAPRRISFPKGDIKIRLKSVKKGQFEITLRSQVFQHGVHLDSEMTSLRFEDNFFDLFPNEEHRVTLNAPVDITRKDIVNTLSARSLVDSYQ